MPNSIKYNTSTETEALNSGDFWVGVGDVDKGPTQTTGYYNGINPPSGGYTIYVNKASGGPSIRVASDDAELISITNKIAGTSYTTINECFNYFDGQNDKMVTHQMLDFRITDGLVLDLDAGAIPSYPQNGTAWNDLSGNGYNGTLTNGPTFNSNGYLDFDGTNDYVDAGDVNPTTSQTLSVWVKLDLIPSSQSSNYPQLMGKRDVDLQRAYFFSFRKATNKVYWEIKDNNGTYFTLESNKNSWDTSEWYCINVTFKGSTGLAEIYINGVLDNSTTWSLNYVPQTTATCRIGGGNYWLDGKIANAKIYDKVLSQTEVLQNYYQAPIITDGLVFAADASNLVSYESGSTTTYSLIGSSTGTLTNGVAFDTSNGGSWTFDGVDDYISTSTLSIGTPSNITLEFWIKFNGTLDSNDRKVMHYDKTGTTNAVFQVRKGNTNRNLMYQVHDGTSWTTMVDSDAIYSDTWAHFTITQQGTSAIMYKNGTQSVTATMGNLDWTNANNILIGYRAASEYWKGDIALMRLYNTALTAAEVTQNYNATKSRFI